MARLPEDLVIGSLLARRLSWSDLGDLCAMHADPLVMQTLGGVRDRAATERYLERNLEHWRAHGFGIYSLRELDSHRRFVGRAGLRRVQLLGKDETEVAYALRREAWGHGLGTVVCQALCGLAEDAGLASELVAFTSPTNQRSRRVMEKADFVYQREFDHDGQPHVLYRCTGSLSRTGVQSDDSAEA